MYDLTWSTGKLQGPPGQKELVNFYYGVTLAKLSCQIRITKLISQSGQHWADETPCDAS